MHVRRGMKFRAPIALTLTLSALTAAAIDCGGAQRLTELVVVVDGDLAFPRDADRVTVVADDGNGHTVSLPAPDREPPPSGWQLPLWGSIAARGELRPVTFTATVYRGTSELMRQTVSADFVPDESREVRITLCKACLGTQCAEGETCGASGACVATRLAELPRWIGGTPTRSTCAAPAYCDAGAGTDAGVPRIMPVSAFNAGHPDYPHTCNIDNILVEDDAVAGLDYAMGPLPPDDVKPITTIDNTKVTGCIGVDFGAVIAIDHLLVRARSIRDSSRTACTEPGCRKVEQPKRCDKCCSPCVVITDDAGVTKDYCDLGGELYAFVGTSLGTYHRVGFDNPPVLLREIKYDAQRLLARYAVLCRGADGPATADLEVDVVKAVPFCP
jgi:hypothetical protein